MFLKSLQIKGFKSFADPAELELEPGVTVVVGPNGSGKSNVVDAIGWVLGAQAPSAVRSQKMDDVIFAGTAKRPALGRAEVALTIDNSAGILPIEFTEVTISRLLFRSGDSEYSINGAPARLLDIQELLSDSGVGRQQHVIVSQGNIDGVLNARPEDRRLIIEEAAGVLKFRRRKERSERRLSATEANLTRINDLLREVRRNLKPLERQADAARRHGEVASELRSLRIFLSGQELARLGRQLESSVSVQLESQRRADEVRASLGDLDARVTAAEAELAALGATDVGDSLMRLERLRERGLGLAAVLRERSRSVAAALEASVDAAVVASLEAERTQLRAESTQIDEEVANLATASTVVDLDEEALAQRWAEFEQRWGEGVPAPTGEAAVMRSELSSIRSATERSVHDRDQLQRRRQAMAERLGRLSDERDAALEATEQAVASAEGLAQGLDVADGNLQSAEAQLEEAESTQRDAEADHSAWRARAEALGLALEDAHQRAGTARLAGLSGVLGTLADLVEVTDGFEEAFEAAASDALGAVVVSDLASAKAAIAALAEGDHGGAVLALGGPIAGVTGVGAHDLAIRDRVRPATHVADRAGVDRLLDRLLGGVRVTDQGWSAAASMLEADPSSVVVTTDGHRFSPTGWRLGAAGSGATAAALEEATERTAGAELEALRALEAARRARSALTEARRAQAEALSARDTNEALRQRSADAADRLALDASEVAEEVSGLEGLLEEMGRRIATETARIEVIEGDLPRLEAEEAELGEKARAMASAREELESAASEIRSQRTDMEVRSAAVAERHRYVAERLEHLDARLEGLAAQASEAAGRRGLLEAQAGAFERLGRFVESRMTSIDSELHDRREERRRQSETARAATARLEELRSERASLETELEQVRERIGRAEVDQAEIRTKLEGASVALRAELDVEPAVAEAAECPLLPEGVSAHARARELQRDLKSMGPINPLALQEFEELSERHEFLESQLHDVRQSRRELTKVIKAVDEEIVKVFTAAFADVSENFSHLFETLFPGGSGRLKLTEPGDLLNTGIELEAKPSGKNVKKLSLLSGGERSLTALAYLFAVFRSRPSPFYVMDEVEAALDDVNLHRFLELITEFRSSAQLVIVSHQKRTMEAADVLYGVSMEPAGSSKVVAERAADVVDVRTG
ncbi:MAG: chromosome segregation protein SMC [Microthrixaceae bacterium]